MVGTPFGCLTVLSIPGRLLVPAANSDIWCSRYSGWRSDFAPPRDSGVQDAGNSQGGRELQGVGNGLQFQLKCLCGCKGKSAGGIPFLVMAFMTCWGFFVIIPGETLHQTKGDIMGLIRYQLSAQSCRPKLVNVLALSIKCRPMFY